MKYTLKIKPYGENNRGQNIDDFDQDEWDKVVVLYERLIRNFQEIYTETFFETLTSKDNIITINFSREIPLTEEENEEYMETLCGSNMENVIIFDDVKYYIRGETVLKK